MFGAIKIVKNIDKDKWIYNGFGKAFDGNFLLSFGNTFARKFVHFGVGISSSSHSDNRKNNFLILDEGSTYDVNGIILMDLARQKERFCIDFSKASSKFWLSLHYNDDNSYLFVYGKEIYKFKAGNKNVDFLT